MSTILVVDDSITVRMDLSDALEEAGYHVVGAATVGAARAALETHPIALALLDVLLPDGDGLELLGWMRSTPRFAELPVLMLSSEADIKDRVRGLRIGATDYLGKPYDTATVIARVRQLLPRAQVSRATILVIDDSPTVRAALVAGLRDAGYATLEASDGAEGLRLAQRERPTAILCDGVMPGMDGASMIRRVRLDANLRTTPCLLITSSDEGVAEVDALEAGADAFVRKDSDLDLVLARIAAMLRSAGESAASSSPSLAVPHRVLAIDDDADFLAQLAEVLADGGYDVAQATRGDEALELLSVQQVDCILLDWTLPGLSGRDICTRIKAAPGLRDTPLIVLTGDDSRKTMLEAYAAGADDFLPKLAGAEVLGARVHAQIRRSQVEDEQRKQRDRLVRTELIDQLERTNAQLTATNEELEAFSYSVSHDLRAPLRSIGAFTAAVLEDGAARLSSDDKQHLERVVRAAKNMSEMIEALLELSRVNRAALQREPVDISAKAGALLDELAQREPDRSVAVSIAPNLATSGDRRLVRVVLDNLLSNAWKFTRSSPSPRIEVGSTTRDGQIVFYVRDNGAGFDMAHAAKLFRPFQRLHADAAFPGTGIGLATARRIVERHGGRIWAEAQPGAGATFYVTFVG